MNVPNSLRMVCLLLSFLMSSGACRPGPEQKEIQAGDRLSVQYTCRTANGEIAATTRRELADDPGAGKSPLFEAAQATGPVVLTAGPAPLESGPGSNRGLEETILARLAAAVVGKQTGRDLEVRLEAEVPAGLSDGDRYLQMARVRRTAKQKTMSVSFFQRFSKGERPRAGLEIETEPGFLGKVVSFDAQSVTLAVRPETRQLDTLFGKGLVTEKGDSYEVVIQALPGRLVRLGPLAGRISRVGEKDFTTDFAHPFGGEILSCEVRAEIAAEPQGQEGEKAGGLQAMAGQEAGAAAVTQPPKAVKPSGFPLEVETGDLVRVRFTATSVEPVGVGPGATGAARTPESPEKTAESVSAGETGTESREAGEDESPMDMLAASTGETGTESRGAGEDVNPGEMPAASAGETGTESRGSEAHLSKGGKPTALAGDTGTESSGSEEVVAGRPASVPGLGELVLGMRVGERRRVELPPGKAYGDWNPQLAVSYPCVKRMPRVTRMTAQDFLDRFHAFPKQGALVRLTPYFDSRVIEARPQETVLENLAGDGARLEDELGTLEVRVSGEEITLTLHARVGAPFTEGKRRGVVSGTDGSSFSVDYNHPGAGKPLALDCEVVSLEKASAFRDARVAWLEDTGLAREAAAARHKPLVMVLYSATCPWSLKLLQETFEDPRIKALRDDFVWVKIESEHQGEVREFDGVGSFPALVVLGADGRVLAQRGGYQAPLALKEALAAALAAGQRDLAARAAS